MINFIETLFGIAAASIVAALVARWRCRHRGARQLAILGITALVFGLLLEVYVRFFAARP